MGFYTNSTNIKNTELKSLAVSLDEAVRNGGAFNEHLSCDEECEKTNCWLLKGLVFSPHPALSDFGQFAWKSFYLESNTTQPPSAGLSVQLSSSADNSLLFRLLTCCQVVISQQMAPDVCEGSERRTAPLC